ncbi:hypothetical protein BDY21DRAFT_372222 [Lineolata rhizophorae]|uniref:UBA domain-containing protein n=1 Tax=Lineolata rhizophorae TaxID=578093 RepID=A0A6A6NYF7_9PEZI|nr:hypothetical protein BDY21DRAFT_372222 [Lineolata rhizophorae]
MAASQPAVDPELFSLPKSSSPIQRRSISIFSRRGTDTPVPRWRSYESEIMTTASKEQLAKTSKSKLRRQSADVKSKSGTILRAVPKSSRPVTTGNALTSLEEAMATSPNEEILQKIGQGTLPESDTQYYSFTANNASGPPKSPKSPKRSRKETYETAPSNVIGVWRDGKVKWDKPEPKSRPLSTKPANAGARQAPEATDASRAPSATSRQQKDKRPRIQVIIPENHRARPFQQPVPYAGQHGQAQPRAMQQPPQPPPRASSSRGCVSPPATPSQVPIRTSVVSPLIPVRPKPQRPAVSMLAPLYQEEEEGDSIHPAKHARPSVSTSSSGSSRVGDDDESSNYSKRSSVTSVESNNATTDVEPAKPWAGQRGSSYSVASPVEAGVFDEGSANRTAPLPVHKANTVGYPTIEKIIPPSPARPPPPPPKELKSSELPPPSAPPAFGRKNSARKSRISDTRFDVLDRAMQGRMQSRLGAASPTLSEAENDLRVQLTAISENNPFQWDAVSPNGRMDDEQHPIPVPRKSSKRLSQLRVNSVSSPAPCSKPKTSSARAAEIRAHVDRNISAATAETVILQILESLHSLDDLFATALVNRGFYRVFKRHELRLIRGALRRTSAPAWELREISPPSGKEREDPDSAVPMPEYTPSTYLRFHMRDSYIVAALKSLVLDRCRGWLRHTTIDALSSADTREASHVDDALWRIWTFCKVFGGGRNREDDIVGQMDWLKGGQLAHQESCTATVWSSDRFDINSVLMNAPECFGKGNDGGLTAEQLFDMDEMWNCLRALLEGLDGRETQAREYGVYDSTEVRGGDVDGEEAMLGKSSASPTFTMPFVSDLSNALADPVNVEEWRFYLVTLGPSAILDLATPLTRDDASALALAREKGWTTWTPPPLGGSRSTFLKEAVARVYEERIAATFAASQAATPASATQQQEMREVGRRRAAEHVLELRQRKVAAGAGGLQPVTMSMERPMSEWDRVMSALDPQVPRAPPPPPPLPTRAAAEHAYEPATPHGASAPMWRFEPRDSVVFAGGVSPVASHGSGGGSRGTPGTPAAALQHPLQRELVDENPAANTADKAIFRIVEMGFTADEARQALRMTDLGDGLRIDRAVELLLRRQQG